MATTSAPRSCRVARSSSEFRRAILGQAVLSVLLCTSMVVAGAIGEVSGGALAALVLTVIMFPGVFLFFWAVTVARSTPRLLWSPPILYDHSEALQNYATAPLALLPVLTVIAGVGMVASLGGNHQFAAQLGRLMLPGAAWIMLALWGYTVVMMHFSGMWTTKEWVVIGLSIPARWLLVGVLVAAQTFFLGLCVIVPFRWFTG